MFDYAILGNGLLGAAAAHHLARRGASVCLAGAAYGAGGRYFSSHADDSRIYRTWHADRYWETLSVANHAAMLRLEAESGVRFFTALPVYYDVEHPSLAQPARQSGYLERNGFTRQDALGGVIDPRRYIEAMNLAAGRAGAVVHEGVVTEVTPGDGGYAIHGLAAPLAARKIIDTRGIHAAQRAGMRVQAKVLVYARHARQHARHCFVKTRIDSGRFKDMYACATGGEGQGIGERTITKFGFSERFPIYLDGDAAIAQWFTAGYRRYPYLDEALMQARRAGYADLHDIAVRPCAFTVTADGRPQVALQDGYLSVAGCNGMAAKCSQALMADILHQHGF